MKGFVVVESCADYEQTLVLREGKELPPGGILDWADHRRRDARAVFGAKSDARAAIERTEHYRLAYGRDDLPERKFCSVVPVQLVTANAPSSADAKRSAGMTGYAAGGNGERND